MNKGAVCCFKLKTAGTRCYRFGLNLDLCFRFTSHQRLLRVHDYQLLKASNGLLSCTGMFSCACRVLRIYEVNPTAVVEVKVRHAGGGN